MNPIIEANVKAIQEQIDGANSAIADLKDKQKSSKEAVKIVEKVKDQLTNNDRLLHETTDIVSGLDAILAKLADDSFDEAIATEKDKIKKLNKALLALQEIDN